MAIARTETYDFLIDTIPRDELYQYVPSDSFVSAAPHNINSNNSLFLQTPYQNQLLYHHGGYDANNPDSQI